MNRGPDRKGGVALARATAAVALVAVLAAAAVMVLADSPARDAGGEHQFDPRRRPPGMSGGFRYESQQLNQGPLPVRMVSYPTPIGPATGLLVKPPGDRRRMPAVIYLHGLGASSSDFATEAVFMAANGAVGLAIDSADVGAIDPPLRGVVGLRADLRLRRATAIRVLNAIALLEDHPDVDPKRIALVGFSRGGAVAALVARRAPNLAAEIYISAGAGLDTWPGAVGRRLDADDRETAHGLAAKIDPVRATARSQARRPRMVQYGSRDRVITPASLKRFAAAVPDPKRVEKFRAGHPLNVRALYERLQWLKTTLQIEGPPVKGAPALTPPEDRR